MSGGTTPYHTLPPFTARAARIKTSASNSVDPDEMSHDVEFHLALHCLQNYALRRGLFNA